MSKPLVSVIIPVYNRENTIEKAIMSVLNQDYSPLELIVVDDASTDKTVDVTQKIDDTRIHICKHEINLGANAARNTGFKNANGEWIAFLDSDDDWHNSKITSIMELLLDTRNSYKVGYCGLNQIRNNRIINTVEAVKSGRLFDELLYKNIIGSFSVPIIHREVLSQVSGLDESLKSAQDWDLWLRIAREDFEFGAIPKSLVNYQMPDSADHISNNLKSFLEGRKQFLKKHSVLYETNPHTLSKVYRDMAFLILHRFNNRQLARTYFIKSIKKNFFQTKAVKGLTGTILPRFLYSYFK